MMTHITIATALVLFLGGCSFTVSAAMCEELRADPHATVPQECRQYSEEEAQKAFDKTQKKQSSEEIKLNVEKE